LAGVAELLPIFPLGMVAFPGMAVPLHVFEERYRDLVRHLLEVPDPAERLFGIVAIREGWEVSGPSRSSGARSLYRTGCVVQLTTHEEYADGRFDIAAVGRHRMRVVETDGGATYLRARVEPLHTPPDRSPAAAVEAARTLSVFERYRAAVGALRGGEVMAGGLPRDPELLSYVLAATCSLTLPERQQLLESPTAPERLAHLRRLLHRELGAIRAVPSLPATEVARSGWSPN
jgi:Lon protease-like protein